MDVTPQLLTEVKFREEWRGYSRDEVDDFLERLAAALEQLQAEYDELAQRASHAQDHSQVSSNEEQLRRTLVLAQRTADAALEEARAEAAQILADAEQHATTTITQAEEKAAQLEQEAAARIQAELGPLASRRAELSAEADALADYVAEHRGRLQAELREQLSWLGRPGRLELPPPPPLSPMPFAVEQQPEAQAYQIEEEAPADQWETAAWGDAPAGWNEPQEWQDEGASLDVRDEEPTGEVPAYANGHAAVGNGYSNGYANGLEANGHDSNGTAVVSELGPEGDYRYDDGGELPAVEFDDDPFLAELRRAVTDPEPLGPRDEDRSEWDLGATVDTEFTTAADLFGRKRRR